MSCVVLCNTGSDSLSKINTESLKVEDLYLSTGENPFGPHGFSLYEDKILVANNYNNSISIVNIFDFKEEKNLYIGAHPNDIKAHNDLAYVACGESNSLIVYDLINERVNFEIPTGKFPHNISLLKEENLIFVSNMSDDSITVIDILKNTIIKKIKVESTPIKIIISKSKQYLYVCMSCLGHDKKGSIGIISLKNLELINKITVGFSPVDVFEEENHIYVSNLCDGTISIIDLKQFIEENIIIVGGMPRGIVKVKEKIFVGDYLNGILKIIDLKNGKIKVIPVGIEPNDITFIEN